jgi:hypothetical protein
MKGLAFFVMICLTTFSVTAYSPVVDWLGGRLLFDVRKRGETRGNLGAKINVNRPP